MIGKMISGFLFAFIIVVGLSIGTTYDKQIKALDSEITNLEQKFNKINSIQNDIINAVEDLRFILESIEDNAIIIEEHEPIDEAINI
jgi:hypothetical protein|tara:strand:- start:4498 stop:4758 length:261 start_codon:yes stop_codon:yes gene_type:complete